MAASITRPTLTATAAASGAAVSLRALRGSASALPLLGMPDHLAGQWRRFAPMDVLRFSVVGRLQAFGMPLAHATRVIAALDDHLAGLAGCGVDLSPDFLERRLAGLTLHVWPNGLARSFPHGTAPASNATIILDIGSIATHVVERLAGRAGPGTYPSTHELAGLSGMES